LEQGELITLLLEIKSNLNNNKVENLSNSVKSKQSINISEDEFVDDSGYTFSSNNNLERDISSSDIELANKINLLKNLA